MSALRVAPAFQPAGGETFSLVYDHLFKETECDHANPLLLAARGRYRPPLK